MSTWRKHHFLEGKSYVANRDVSAPPDFFKKGEVYKFSSAEHSAYYSSTRFFFFDKENNSIAFEVLDDDSLNECELLLGAFELDDSNPGKRACCP